MHFVNTHVNRAADGPVTAVEIIWRNLRSVDVSGRDHRRDSLRVKVAKARFDEFRMAGYIAFTQGADEFGIDV